jgi:hypothetical protein
MRSLLLLWLALPAWAQFQLYVVAGGSETAAPSLYDFGAIYPGETANVHFRLRNTSAAPASVTMLAVAGSGFNLTTPGLPVSLAPQAALDFTIGFQATGTGSYSAALRTDGISILLAAIVLPRLTLAGSFDFGTVVRDSSATQRFTITNGTAQILIVPAIAVQGADFSLVGVPPSGQAYSPQQSGEFAVVFSPHAATQSQGTLVFGDRKYPLTGAGTDPPLPKPFLTVDLQQVASAQQGTVIIRFDTPVKTAASGSLALDFRGPADPTVVFASGGRAATFAVSPGDTQARIPFQTGTTAGTLTFTAQLGSSSDQLSVPIPAAPPASPPCKGAVEPPPSTWRLADSTTRALSAPCPSCSMTPEGTRSHRAGFGLMRLRTLRSISLPAMPVARLCFTPCSRLLAMSHASRGVTSP